MLKSDLIVLYQALGTVSKLQGVKFAYMVGRNLALIKQDLDALNLVTKPSKEFQDYEDKRVELAKSMAKKDDKGKEVIEGDAYVMEDDKAFDEAFKNLKSEYAEVIAARQKQIDEYNSLLKTESSIQLHKIKMDDLPKEINGQQMQAILQLVQE